MLIGYLKILVINLESAGGGHFHQIRCRFSNLTDSQYFLAKESRGAGSPAIFPIEWLRAFAIRSIGGIG